jgi:hypothetical protein
MTVGMRWRLANAIDYEPMIGGDSSAGALRRSPASILLAGAMTASGALLLVLGSRLSFLLDDWVFILYRRGSDARAFFAEDNEHLVAGPVAIYKLLLNTFGMSSTLPFRVVSTALFLLGVAFLFVWLRRRLGDWPALLAVVPVLFMGAAYDDLLWFSSITFLGALACGLGMLLALDRRDAMGDRLACAWLVGSLLFSSLWVAFAAGALVDIALRRRERGWLGRIYVLAVPAILYVAWWLGWGHEGESALSLHNVALTPIFVLDSIAAGLAAFLGLATPAEGIASPAGLDWGRPLLVVAAGLALWRAYRMERIPRSLWVVLAIGGAFWVLGGFDVKPGRVAWASRYQLPTVAFLLLIGAELLRGVRLRPRLLWVAVVVVAAAVVSNGYFLWAAYKSYRSTSEIERADLGAVEIARDMVEPGFLLEEDIADTNYVTVDAGSYLSARDAYGSPAYTPEEIAAAPEPARVAADKVLAAALRLQLAPLPAAGAPRRLGSCSRARPAQGSAATVQLPPGGVVMRSRAPGPVAIRLRRFAPLFPVELGALRTGAWAQLAIPRDRSERPWQMQLSGDGPVLVCPA